MSFDSYVRRVFTGTLLLVLVAAGIFMVVGLMPWARGVVLGGAASLFNLLIMAGDVRRQSRPGSRSAAMALLGRYSLRMTATAAALVYAAVNESIVLWGTIPALFASQVVMSLGEMISDKEKEPS